MIDKFFFNGTRDGEPYHAVVTRRNDWLDVSVVIFSRETGNCHYSFDRLVHFDTTSDPKRAVALILRNPELY